MNYLKGFIFLTSLLVLSRIIPHPPNFTPLLAGIIFLPFIQKDIKFSILVPMTSMLVSDFIIGMHALMLWTYASILLLSVLSFYFSRDNALRVGTLAMISPMIFYVISNFGVWMNSSFYTRDLNGLFECYLNAIPFYANSAVACMLFSSAFFMIVKYYQRSILLNH